MNEKNNLHVALELHAESDEAHFRTINDRFDSLASRLDDKFKAVDEKFDRLEDRMTANHAELLVAVTELRTTQSNAGTKSGIITSGVLLAAFEAIKQFLVK